MSPIRKQYRNLHDAHTVCGNDKDFEQIVRILIVPRSINKLGGPFGSQPSRPFVLAICKYNPKGTGFRDDKFKAQEMRKKYVAIKAAVAAGKIVQGGVFRTYRAYRVKSFYFHSQTLITDRVVKALDSAITATDAKAAN